jgi:hypothetical protein
LASGIFYTAIQAIKTQLTSLGLVAVTDPRNVRPLSVLIEMPSFDSFTSNVGNISIPVRIIGAPPANQDTSDYLVTTADRIMNSPISVTSGSAGYATYGGQELPTYDLQVAVVVRRN